MPRLAFRVCIALLAMRCAATPTHGLRRVAAEVAQHGPHGETIRAVSRQASAPVRHAAGHAARRVAATPAEEARSDLSRHLRAAEGVAAARATLRQASKNDTSREVLEPTILEAQDALQMLESVRATLEEVSGLQRVSADPVKSRASLAVEIADMEALLNGTDGAKWQPLLAPTVAAARQAYKDLGVPGEGSAANATGTGGSGPGGAAAAPEPTPTEPPAMPYHEDAVLDQDFPWDDGYLSQYENETSGDAIGSLPPPPGGPVAMATAPDAGGPVPSSPLAGAGPVALGRGDQDPADLSPFGSATATAAGAKRGSRRG